MFIKINGKNESIDSGISLKNLLSAKSLVLGHVVVEHNMRIVPKEELGAVMIRENDSIEIISFVGGG